MVLYRLTVDETQCMSCGACMDLCPFTALEFTRPDGVRVEGSLLECVDDFDETQAKVWMMEAPYLPIQERCTGCQICVRECPTNAITVEPDESKSPSIKPKPVMLNRELKMDDAYWKPLSEYTRDFLKRPVRSPWSQVAAWTPLTKQRGVHETWRTMSQ